MAASDLITPPIPPDEEQRLEDLRRLDILLTAPEESLDEVTRELARIFQVPAAMISFIDHDTQYYKSAVGLPPPFSETRTEPRDLSICSHVVGTNEMLVVEDLSLDDRFRNNPVVQSTGARFYAGAPLRGDSGSAIGSVCIVDIQPRKISERERDLLSLLASGVMAQVRLQVASRKLLERTVQMESDLQQAVRTQEYLLPPATITGDGWRIDHLYRPVDRLGGDFIDVCGRPDGRMAILVADIAGHGTSAALTTAMTKTAFQRAAPDATSPAALLNAIHHELVGITPPDLFMSAIAVLFDPSDRVAELASAGHPYPLLITRDGVRVMKFESDIVMLVAPETEYRSHCRLVLEPGNRLLIYTDGVIEAADDGGDLLDLAGFARIVGEAAGVGAERFLPSVFGGVRAFADGRLHDDVALLSLSAE